MPWRYDGAGWGRIKNRARVHYKFSKAIYTSLLIMNMGKLRLILHPLNQD